MRRALLTLALALVAAGCGGDDRLSADEYRAEGRKICEESQRQTERIEQPTRITPESVADYFRRQLEITDRNLERFGELDPPEELQEPHDRIVRVSREGANEIRGIVEAIEKGEDPRSVLVGAQRDLQRISDEQAELARRLGIPDCGARE